MPVLLLFSLISLTSWRLARLITKDVFPPAVWLRERVGMKWGTGSWQSYLAECPVCVGVYTSALVVAATVGLTDVSLPAPLLWWGAGAASVVWLNNVEHTLDQLSDFLDPETPRVR